MPPTNWFSSLYQWFLSWFVQQQQCSQREIFMNRFFSLHTWVDASRRNALLEELARHRELEYEGAKENIVNYLNKKFVHIMSRLSMELKDKGGLDVTPLVSFVDEESWPPSRLQRNAATPVIVVPGVSSSCRGLVSLVVKFLKHYLNTEHVECIGHGDTIAEQVAASWFMGGEDTVEHFRQRVLANEVYAERGFNVLAFSQGNFVTRGYVQQYNGMTIDGKLHPAAKSWVAMNGPVLGQGGIPTVVNSNWWGASLDRVASWACDHPTLAELITPCAYMRVPMHVSGAGYRSRPIAKLNGETLGPNPTAAEREEREAFLSQSKENMNRLTSLVAVKNKGDTVIKPLDAEWLGTYGGSFEEVLSFQETSFHREDTFGLKSLHSAGKVHFVETPGELEHCIFSTADLRSWVDSFWETTSSP